MGLSPTNGLACHPGDERYQRHLNSDLAPPTIHSFLNASNGTSLQANCSLTYVGENLYLPTSFWQALLQRNILAIPEPDTPTRLPLLLTPPHSAGPANAQQR